MAEDFGREIAACPDCGERRTEFSVHVCINVGVNAAFAAMATDEDYRKAVQELTPSAPTESMEEIAKLANFILEEFPGEPSANESAVDVAIRLLRERASMPTLTREEVGKGLGWTSDKTGVYIPWDDFPKVADRLNAILAAKSQKGGDADALRCPQ